MGEGLDYLSRANMKVFLFSLFFVACSAQRGAFLKEILNGDLNPCGAGVKPTTCTCADGTTVGPGQARFRGAGLKGPCGAGISVSCKCSDGSTFTPGSIIDNKQCGERPGNPCGSGRPTCECPNGESFSPRELRTLLKELVQG